MIFCQSFIILYLCTIRLAKMPQQIISRTIVPTQMQPSPPTLNIKLTPLDRILMVSCFVVQILLFGYFNLMITHYTFMPMPGLFSTPSLLASPYHHPSYLFNALLYASFFVQHVCMALIVFKMGLQGLWVRYPLYERYIYNITSSLAQILILTFAKPVFDQSVVLFKTPMIINGIISAIAGILLIMSILRLGGDIFSPFSLKKILASPSLQLPHYNTQTNTKLVSTGLYSYCRHPMQGSVILLLLFASNQYTFDRLIFVAVNLLGIVVGVTYEEKRLRVKFPGYGEYERKVPYKFLPYLM